MHNNKSFRLKFTYLPLIILFLINNKIIILETLERPETTRDYAPKICLTNSCSSDTCFNKSNSYGCVCYLGYRGQDCVVNLNSNCLNDFSCGECEVFSNDTQSVTDCLNVCIDKKCQHHSYRSSLNVSNSLSLLNKTLSNLVDSTSDQASLNESNLADTVSSTALVLNKLTKNNNSNITDTEKVQEAKLFFHIVDQTINLVSSVNNTSTISTLTVNITKSVETYSVNSLNLTKFQITTDNLALVSFSINNSTRTNGFTAGINTTGIQLISSSNSSSQNVSLIKAAGFLNFTKLSDVGKLSSVKRVSFSIFQNSFLFDVASSKIQKINSTSECRYITVDQIVTNVVSISTNKPIKSDEYFVSTQFRTIPEAVACEPFFKPFSFKCVFWDYNRSAWNSYGCIYSLNNESLHQCDCNHLTSFAVLMSFSSNKSECKICETILEYVTYVGNVLSIIGLMLTIAVYLRDYVKKNRYKSNRQPRFMFDYYVEILITLSASLLMMNVFYIIFSLITWDRYLIGCVFVGAFLHFFLLSSFFLMLSLAFLQYLIFNKVLVIVNRYYLISVLVSFGIPLLAVSTIISIDWKLYLHPNNYCWLRGLPSIFAILLPITLILIANSIAFGLIMRKHCYLYQKDKKIIASQAHKNTNIKRQTLILSTCFINMGLTWTFGIFLQVPMREQTKTIIAFVFCVLNSFQGFLMFTIYLVFSKSRRNYLKYVALTKMRRFKKALSSNKYDKTLTNSKNQTSSSTTNNDYLSTSS